MHLEENVENVENTSYSPIAFNGKIVETVEILTRVPLPDIHQDWPHLQPQDNLNSGYNLSKLQIFNLTMTMLVCVSLI